MIYIYTGSAMRALQKLQAELSEANLAKAQMRAINRSLERGRTTARKEVKKVYNIPQKNLNGVNYKRATVATLTGNLFADRKPLPLDIFEPEFAIVKGGKTLHLAKITKRGVLQQKNAPKNTTGGVTIKIFKNQKEVIPYAFMLPGGALRVFARGEYRGGTQHGFVQRHVRVSNQGNDIPIKPLISLSPFGSVINKGVMRQITTDVKVFYPNRLEHEVVNILRSL